MNAPQLGVAADARVVDAVPPCPACLDNGVARPAEYYLPQSSDAGRTVTWTLACAGHADGWHEGGDNWTTRIPGYRLTPLPAVSAKQPAERVVDLEEENARLRKACAHVLSVLDLMPAPRLGEWNWPSLADQLRDALRTPE